MTENKAERTRRDAHERGLYPAPLNAGRSRNMRANRRTDTKPEVVLRKALHRQGFRFRKDLRIEIGSTKVRPDIVFTRRKVAIFVDGCFWHVCPEHGRMPTTNDWYWTPKLRRNMERDRAATAALTEAGWTVIRLWEHEDLTAAVATVLSALEGRSEHVSDSRGETGEDSNPAI
ncbi:very short patch repair endonuclease [Nocardia rhamnosiphila]